MMDIDAIYALKQLNAKYHAAINAHFLEEDKKDAYGNFEYEHVKCELIQHALTMNQSDLILYYNNIDPEIINKFMIESVVEQVMEDIEAKNEHDRVKLLLLSNRNPSLCDIIRDLKAAKRKVVSGGEYTGELLEHLQGKLTRHLKKDMFQTELVEVFDMCKKTTDPLHHFIISKMILDIAF